jgi:peptidyl-prolyl cis-trans isomerase C
MKLKIANNRFLIAALVALAASSSPAQVASHTPTAMKSMGDATAPPAARRDAPSPAMQVSDKPVARVNGTVLSDRDLLREMFDIFPYARQHNGFPKGEEAKIRQGALKMIEFEELVYQEAERRKMTIPAARLDQAVAAYRRQFPTEESFNEYLKTELKGSRQALRARIRRSLLIDALLKAEVDHKSAVSAAEAHAFYDKNPKLFEYGESFSIQTISVLPPSNGGDAVKKEARKRAEDALRQAKATKSYQEFGLLAEKLSEDDYHVNMGDHKAVDRDKLPPPIVAAALAMKPGQVSELIQLGEAYTLFRLNAHTPPGKVTFEAVKSRLLKDLEKDKHERLRAEFDERLRKSANVQEM